MHQFEGEKTHANYIFNFPVYTKQNFKLSLTLCRPAMRFGNRKKNILEDISLQYCRNLKNIPPLETSNLII